jgi:protein-S-isoprenylcysteine O-methyltransferase Ste14
MPIHAARSLAVACYLVALGGAGLFALFVLGQGLDLWPDIRHFAPRGACASEGPSLTLPARSADATALAWLIDLGWLLLFGVQHSGMARQSFKGMWTRIVPVWLERSLYAALSGVLVGMVPLLWQPLPFEPLWRLPRAFAVVPALAVLGMALINLRFDHAGLFGLRQAWYPDRAAQAETLVVTGPYHFVRHPLMACLLVFLWTQPVMRPELALLAGGLSVYIGLGVALEERDLRRRFHPDYDLYRRRVPMLVPWRWLPSRERA